MKLLKEYIIDPYRLRVLVIVNKTKEEICKDKLVKKYYKHLIDYIEINDITESLGLCVSFENNDNVIILNEASQHDMVEAIIHESTHATQFIMECVGTVYSQDSWETYAYTQSFIASNILKDCKLIKVRK
jgi:hypothetical protein